MAFWSHRKVQGGQRDDLHVCTHFPNLFFLVPATLFLTLLAFFCCTLTFSAALQKRIAGWWGLATGAE